MKSERRKFLKFLGSTAVLSTVGVVLPTLNADSSCDKEKKKKTLIKREIGIPMDLSFTALHDATLMFLNELTGNKIYVGVDGFVTYPFVSTMIVHPIDIPTAKIISEKYELSYVVDKTMRDSEWHILFEFDNYPGLYEVWSRGV